MKKLTYETDYYNKMKVKEAIKTIETLEGAIQYARSPEEAISIQFEINRLKDSNL